MAANHRTIQVNFIIHLTYASLGLENGTGKGVMMGYGSGVGVKADPQCFNTQGTQGVQKVLGRVKYHMKTTCQFFF